MSDFPSEDQYTTAEIMEPLFANGDLGKLIVALVVAAIYLVHYIVKASNEAKAARLEKERAEQDVYTPRQSSPGPRTSPNGAERAGRHEGRAVPNSRYNPRHHLEARPGYIDEAVPDDGGLTNLQAALPSRDAFDSSEPLATPKELTGLNTDLLPSDHMDRIYHDATAATGTAPRQGSTLTADLLRMFSSPQSMQQAVLLAEILNRPDFDTPGTPKAVARD